MPVPPDTHKLTIQLSNLKLLIALVSVFCKKNIADVTEHICYIL